MSRITNIITINVVPCCYYIFINILNIINFSIIKNTLYYYNWFYKLFGIT